MGWSPRQMAGEFLGRFWAPSIRGSGRMVGFCLPTLKRGANNRCAYGASEGRLPALRWHQAGDGTGWAVRAMVRTVMSSAWGAPEPKARAAWAMALAD